MNNPHTQTIQLDKIKSPSSVPWTVPPSASAKLPTPGLQLPVLATPHLIDAMQTASLSVLTGALKHPHCKVAVPGTISITHSAPVSVGARLTLTTEYKGRDGAGQSQSEGEGNETETETHKLQVTASDPLGVIATATFSHSIVCSVNLASHACLRLRQKDPARAAALEGIRQICNPATCDLCYPVRPDYAWRGLKIPHSPTARGLLHAVHHGPEQLVAAWLQAGTREALAPALDSALFAAVQANRDGVLKVLVAQGGADPVKWTGSTRHPTLLHLAADNGDESVATALLELGLDPNARDDEYYWTPLHHAVHAGHSLGTIRALLDGGADPNASEDESWTSLHFAVERGNIASIRLLVKRGASLSAENLKGDTPIMMAVRLGDKELVKTLLDCGSDPGLGYGRCSAFEWLRGAKVPGLDGAVRSLRP